MSQPLMRVLDFLATSVATRAKTHRPGNAGLLLALSLLLGVAPSLAQQSVAIQTGLPISFTTLALHEQGQPMNVYEFTVSLYPMNTPPPWPAGLWLYIYVQGDAGSSPSNKSTWGQSEWCRWWINQVASLEQQNPQQLPYPYFEMNLQTGVSLIQTDEGIPVYPAGSVTCWQANNDYAP